MFRSYLLINALAMVAFIVPSAVITLVFFTRVQAIFASAIVAAVMATIAGILHVVTDVPIAVLWLVLVVLSLVLMASFRSLRSRAIENARIPVSRQEYIQLGVVATLVLFVVSFVPAPLAWDARSIWLFHASWLNSPAQAFLDGQTLDAIDFSHPNYPILGPASMAVTWGFAGGVENLILGVQVIALLTILVISLAASLVIRKVAPTGNAWVNSLAFTFFVTSAFTVSDGLLNQGYMDPLQAVFIIALLAVMLPVLSERITWSAGIFASIVALGAMNVKQEGFWFTATVIVVVLVLSWRSQYWAKYLPLAAIVVFYGLWKVFLGFVHAIDESDASGVVNRLTELLDRSSPAWGILTRIAKQEATAFLLPSFAIMVLFLLVYLFLSRTWVAAKQVAAIAAIWFIVMGIVVLTYALGNTRDQIDWWLSASFSRIIGTGVLLAWFCVFFVILRISPWRARQSPPAPMSDSDTHHLSTEKVS
jgi:hypothetical protein